MKDTLTAKILKQHLLEGTYQKGQEVGIRIDQTITQDATGTMAYLQLEALGIDRVKTELSVSYIDHNTLQQDFKNPDDHQFLQDIAAKYGIVLSKAGNGICHQVHLERFAKPGKTQVGSDSHTPTAGGIGAIAIGVGGLDAALCMAGHPFFVKVPAVVNVYLTGALQPGVAAKDVILEVLRRIDVKGGVGKVLEYSGPGVATLSVPERATITNMGAETGATTSIFPSDAITREFLESMNRVEDWTELAADDGAEYDEVIEINLSEVEPLAAMPHSPGKVGRVAELAGMKVNQVAIGSCTNSSFKDLMTAAAVIKGRRVNPETSLLVSPGSRTILKELAKRGALADLVAAGARILECACGPCIGQGGAPVSDGVSVRTFNRNFEGRSGTKSAQAYLTSVETAIATAINGVLTDPRTLDAIPTISDPEKFDVDDALIVYPPADGSSVEVTRGPNIAPLPQGKPLPASLTGEVLLKEADNITTDDIMPAGKYLPLRSNVPEYAKHVFEPIDEGFAARALAKQGGFVVAGENYGQGSSREHAALCPMYLGVKAVITKSFARIHLANLVNFGILPLTLDDAASYDDIDQGDLLELDVSNLDAPIKLINKTKGSEYAVSHPLTAQDIAIIKAGGKLAYYGN
jgi:aconitate hydratase